VGGWVVTISFIFCARSGLLSRYCAINYIQGASMAKELVFDIELVWKAPQNDERRHFSTRIPRPGGGTTLIYPGVSYKLQVTEDIMRDLLKRQAEYDIKPFRYEKRVPMYEEIPTKVVVIDYDGAQFTQHDKEENEAVGKTVNPISVPPAGVEKGSIEFHDDKIPEENLNLKTIKLNVEKVLKTPKRGKK